MRRLWALPLLALWLAGCDDSNSGGESKSAPAEESGGGGGGAGSAGAGSGDVAIGSGSGDKTTIADRYRAALDMIKKRDWDGARAQLVEAMNRSEGKEIQKEIKEHLKLVDQGILSQPVFNVDQVFAGAGKLLERYVSIRGKFIPGGEVGKVTYYFWLESGHKIQCRYGALSLAEKKRILSLKEGAQALVRGQLKSPWGSNPNPYLELTFFRLEKLSPQQQAELDQAQTEAAP